MRTMPTCLFVTAVISLLLLAAATEVYADENADSDFLYVEVKTAKLRESPVHWSKPVADLQFGERLKHLSSNQGWAAVEAGSGISGFIHASAVTTRKVVFKERPDSLPGLRESDVVLAGKGFNQEIESRYHNGDPSLNYQAVEEMERLEISHESLLAFITDGALVPDETLLKR